MYPRFATNRSRKGAKMGLAKTNVEPRLRFTYSDYRLLPDNGKRYELIDGDLIMMPSQTVLHQDVLASLLLWLFDFVKKNAAGEVLIAPLDVVLSKYDVVQPDIFFISKKNRHIITQPCIRGMPGLIAEVLLPKRIRHDRTVKRKLYARYGLPELWLVGPAKRCVEVYRLQDGELQRVHTLAGNQKLTSPLLPGFEITVNSIFPETSQEK